MDSMSKIECPKCKLPMTKVSKETDAVNKQKKMFPQFTWIQYICKCGYETVRSTK